MSNDSFSVSEQPTEPLCLQCVSLQREHAELQETLAAFASELHFIYQWIANPFVRDKEKVSGIGYILAYYDTKPRSDGYRYYSLPRVAEHLGNVRAEDARQGNKEQAFGKVHQRFIASGLIDSKKEPQRDNPFHHNVFDRITPQWEMNPAGVVLDYGENAGNHGGRRIRLHRECGGEVIAHITHVCTKCGQVKIPHEAILNVSQEKWERWKMEDEAAALLQAEQEAEAIIKPVLTLQSRPPYPPLARACYVCGVEMWMWDSEAGQYYCGNHQQKVS